MTVVQVSGGTFYRDGAFASGWLESLRERCLAFLDRRESETADPHPASDTAFPSLSDSGSPGSLAGLRSAGFALPPAGRESGGSSFFVSVLGMDGPHKRAPIA